MLVAGILHISKMHLLPPPPDRKCTSKEHEMVHCNSKNRYPLNSHDSPAHSPLPQMDLKRFIAFGDAEDCLGTLAVMSIEPMIELISRNRRIAF
jgi:hypothetical protein